MIRYKDGQIIIARYTFFTLLEVLLLLVVLFSFGPLVLGGVGGNVTVTTTLQVGNVSPEILNVSLDNDSASVTLIANSTQSVSCIALVVDYNNDTTLANATARFFDNVLSGYNNASDNNHHYRNDTCAWNRTFGSWNGYTDDNYSALAQCTFSVQYYANPGTWNCTVVVNDTTGLNASGWDNISINNLLAVGLPDSIDYGTINATYVSSERTANVTNVGNVRLNLSLYGYGYTLNDNNSMNCTLGANKNISIGYEKYNLTTSIAGGLTLTQFSGNYTNLTSAATVKNFNLSQRQNDTNYGIDDTKPSYWRIYVPTGVAGTCNGNIVFGAAVAPGS